jgi:hypothetical protein
MIFTGDRFTALCSNKCCMTVDTDTILRNRCFISQVKFLVVVNLFVSRPSQKHFFFDSGEEFWGKESDLKAKENILLKFLSLGEVFLLFTASKHFIINNDIHNSVLHALLE